MAIFTTPDGWIINGETATRGDETRPTTDNEKFLANEIDESRAVSDQIIAQNLLNEQAEANRLAILSQPLTPLPIDGATIEEVKASADASVNDLATQMQAKLDAITGGA